MTEAQKDDLKKEVPSDIKKVFNQLESFCTSDGQKNDIHALRAEFDQNEKTFSQGTLGQKIYKLVGNRIVRRLLILIDEIYTSNSSKSIASEPVETPTSFRNSREHSLQGTWYTYRHRIDLVKGKLQKSQDEKNITQHTVIFRQSTETKNQYQYTVESKFLGMLFIGTAHENEDYIFIRFEQKEGDNHKKVVSISIEKKQTIVDNNSPNSDSIILRGIANTYTLGPQENVHPIIGIPIVFEKINTRVNSVRLKIDDIPLSSIKNESVKNVLEENDNFTSIIAQENNLKPLNNGGNPSKSIFPQSLSILFSAAALLFFLLTIVFAFKNYNLNEKIKALVNPPGEKHHNFNIYTAIPSKVRFIQDEYDKFAAEIKAATNDRLIFNFIKGDKFKLEDYVKFMDSVRVNENVAIISVPYYQDNTIISQESFMSSLPFGMNSLEFDAWLKLDGGLELLQEYYGTSMHTVPFGCTGNQPFGWFFKEINHIKDLDSLHMRIYGPSGTILKGALDTFYTKTKTPNSFMTDLAGIPSFNNIKTWMITHHLNIAFEYINPAVDSCIGIYEFAERYHNNSYGNNKENKPLYLYKNGRHEPHTTYLFFFNKKMWDNLSNDDKELLSQKLEKFHDRISKKFELEGAATLNRWGKSNSKHIEIRTLNQGIIDTMEMVAKDLLNKSKGNSKDRFFKKVFDSYNFSLKKYENRPLLKKH